MSGVNKVILIGRLGKDPEIRNLESGISVANFSMATTNTYKDKTTGERKELTEWHNIVLWRGLADVAAKYLHKGDLVYIEGRLRTRSWEKDNVTRYTTEIFGDTMNMLTPKSTSPSSGGAGSSGGSNPEYAQPRQAPSAPAHAQAPDNATDDLPF